MPYFPQTPDRPEVPVSPLCPVYPLTPVYGTVYRVCSFILGTDLSHIFFIVLPASMTTVLTVVSREGDGVPSPLRWAPPLQGEPMRAREPLDARNFFALSTDCPMIAPGRFKGRYGARGKKKKENLDRAPRSSRLIVQWLTAKRRFPGCSGNRSCPKNPPSPFGR